MSASATSDNYKLGKLLIEGKTKQIYELADNPGCVYILSKDRITAGDGVKQHDLKGKATISTSTTTKIFELMNTVGVRTHFIKRVSEKAMVTRNCAMIPIEWVTRRVATGSYLRRYPEVKEGFRFTPVKTETFFKDDANHDPQWQDEQILAANFNFGGLQIGPQEIDVMKRTSIIVFEVLERAWASLNCALIDMKVEFGVDVETGKIVLADVIDSDSYRLWPSGDKRLMKDKQFYRNLTNVTQEDLDKVKKNFEWIEEKLNQILPPSTGKAVIVMGSPSDREHCEAIKKHCNALGVQTDIRVCSAHKTTQPTMDLIAQYEGLGADTPIVFIAVAGRSNGLGPVLSGNCSFPVISCTPVKGSDLAPFDIWSSINTPSGLGCTTVIYPEAAAVAAAQIFALSDHVMWSKLKVKQLANYVSLLEADKKQNATN